MTKIVKICISGSVKSMAKNVRIFSKNCKLLCIHTLILSRINQYEAPKKQNVHFHAIISKKSKFMKSIIFVCLGNICRSPLAQGIARDLNQKHHLGLTIASAGTGDWHIGEAPCPHSITVAKQHGIDISDLRGQQVKPSDFSDYDLVVGLDDSNIANLKALGCSNPLKLGDFGFDGEDVPDPYFFDGFEGFEKVYQMIETGVINILDHYLENFSK